MTQTVQYFLTTVGNVNIIIIIDLIKIVFNDKIKKKNCKIKSQSIKRYKPNEKFKLMKVIIIIQLYIFSGHISGGQACARYTRGCDK